MIPRGFAKYAEQGHIDKKTQRVLDKMKRAGVNFVIGGSYGMRSVRKPHDLDILVRPKDWGKLVNLNIGTVGKDMAGDPRIVLKGTGMDVEAFREGYPKGFGYDDMKHYGVDSKGNQAWTLSQTKRWKKVMGRPKDKRDLDMIEKTAARGVLTSAILKRLGMPRLAGANLKMRAKLSKNLQRIALKKVGPFKNTNIIPEKYQKIGVKYLADRPDEAIIIALPFTPITMGPYKATHYGLTKALAKGTT